MSALDALRAAYVDRSTYAGITSAADKLAADVASAAAAALDGEDHPAVKAALTSFATRAGAARATIAGLGEFTHPRGARLSDIRWDVVGLVREMNGTDFDAVAAAWDARAAIAASRPSEKDARAAARAAAAAELAAAESAVLAMQARVRAVDEALRGATIDDAMSLGPDYGQAHFAALVAQDAALRAELAQLIAAHDAAYRRLAALPRY